MAIFRSLPHTLILWHLSSAFLVAWAVKNRLSHKGDNSADCQEGTEMQQTRCSKSDVTELKPSFPPFCCLMQLVNYLQV